MQEQTSVAFPTFKSAEPLRLTLAWTRRQSRTRFRHRHLPRQGERMAVRCARGRALLLCLLRLADSTKITWYTATEDVHLGDRITDRTW